MNGILVECVPNFSEGRDRGVIDQITREIEQIEGVLLLDVDAGKATNRTVVTMVGPPAAILEAAVRSAKKACELIDMRNHRGEHPRFGAMDVCPLVPVSGISLAEAAEWAHRLAKRLAGEVGMTIFCYEAAATTPRRKNLAEVRAGEYEGLAAKLALPDWQPDYGPAQFNARSGATAVGARDFLVAYNVNLNTTSTRRANAIAFDVREKGRELRENGALTGKILRDATGEPLWQPGTLKATKAIGWFIEEYGIAQVSMNLTDIGITPVHVAFDEVCAKAAERGVRVTGSELVGVVPLRSMLEAGRYFLEKQQRSVGVSDDELVKIAVRSLGLADLTPFDPSEKIIEYAIAKRQKAQRSLQNLTVRGFVEETASESAAPGGGSVAALLGALAAALGTMVANLSAHKRGWDERWQEFSGQAAAGKQLHMRLGQLIDEDTRAFDAIMAALGMPRATDADKQARSQALRDATLQAIAVPLQTMRVAAQTYDLLEAMAKTGNPASISDVGVGVLCATAAVRGAHLNVRINAGGLKNPGEAAAMLAEANQIAQRAAQRETAILALVEGHLTA
ncbi:MAG: glutamate formimidoyltransferase [Deltaproteobacteria bacterium]|nr:glutamate formimidoyltransferase [Deltaproteobacteria bacterium]